MKYLCLGYHDQKRMQSMNDLERLALFEESRVYNERLCRGGHFVEGRSLQGGGGTTTLRFEAGRIVVAEGPAFNTREQLGGLMVLQARDLNQAIQLLSHLPAMQSGGVLEIRPLVEE